MTGKVETRRNAEALTSGAERRHVRFSRANHDADFAIGPATGPARQNASGDPRHFVLKRMRRRQADGSRGAHISATLDLEAPLLQQTASPGGGRGIRQSDRYRHMTPGRIEQSDFTLRQGEEAVAKPSNGRAALAIEASGRGSQSPTAQGTPCLLDFDLQLLVEAHELLSIGVYAAEKIGGSGEVLTAVTRRVHFARHRR